MPTFTSKKYHPSTLQNTLGARYRRSLSRHPFLLFGLPFIGTILAGSFFLTPATALRYERHDRKIQRISQEEAMGLGRNKRKVDLNEEYYVRCSPSFLSCVLGYVGSRADALRGGVI